MLVVHGMLFTHVIPLVYTGHFNHNTNKDNQRYITTSVYATFPQHSTVGPEFSSLPELKLSKICL